MSDAHLPSRFTSPTSFSPQVRLVPTLYPLPPPPTTPGMFDRNSISTASLFPSTLPLARRSLSSYHSSFQTSLFLVVVVSLLSSGPFIWSHDTGHRKVKRDSCIPRDKLRRSIIHWNLQFSLLCFKRPRPRLRLRLLDVDSMVKFMLYLIKKFFLWRFRQICLQFLQLFN